MPTVGVLLGPHAFLLDAHNPDIAWAASSLRRNLAARGIDTVFFASHADVEVGLGGVYAHGLDDVHGTSRVSARVDLVWFFGAAQEFLLYESMFRSIENAGVRILNSCHTLSMTTRKHRTFESLSEVAEISPFFYVESLRELYDALANIVPEKQYVVKMDSGGAQGRVTGDMDLSYLLIQGSVNQYQLLRYLMLTRHYTRGGVVITEFITPARDSEGRARVLKVHVVNNVPLACRYDLSEPGHWLTDFHKSGADLGEDLSDLPPHVHDVINAIASRYQLDIASIDFLLSDTGPRLIEINSVTGDLLRLRNLSGIDLTEPLAEYMAGLVSTAGA